MFLHRPPRIRHLLAPLLAAAAPAWALDLAQAPPASVQPFVPPNVLLSLDDSGSMEWRLGDNMPGIDLAQPGADGQWPAEVNRASVLRNALTQVFSDQTLLPDGSIRLAWQTMGDCAAYKWRLRYIDGRWRWVSRQGKHSSRVSALSLDSDSSSLNAMRVLDATHRRNFLEYISFFQGCVGTPTHTMVSNADAYLRGRLNLHSPWALRPGEKAEPYLGCRRNYHILMTDGGWNDKAYEHQIPGTANFDGTGRPLPDGTAYAPFGPQTRIYSDSDSGSPSGAAFSTVADWAFRSWALPLQPQADLQGRITPGPDYLQAPASETFTSPASGDRVTLQRYWNPRHNPATWPHMVTFTVGFSEYALPQSNYTPDGQWHSLITAPSSTLPYGYDGSFADYASGRFSWRAAGGITQEAPDLPNRTPQWSGRQPRADRGHDMWHAALNSRGRFYAVNRSEDLATAFRQIVQQISTEIPPDRGSATASASAIARGNVGLYTAHYNPGARWSGWISAQAVQPDGSTLAAPGWQGRDTAGQLDRLTDPQAVNGRLILSWSDAQARGVAFKWAQLDVHQKALLGQAHDGTADGLGAARLDYLRGDRRKEGDGQPFRQRKSRQGDIVNSLIWHMGPPASHFPLPGYADFTRALQRREAMLYVGGNDGMLHGFSAVDGREKIAYVPRGVMAGLARLSDPGYDARHRYFVDGSPLGGDADLGSDGEPRWRTLLAGTAGAGARGYFLLDVTDPADFAESAATSLVLLDRTLDDGSAPQDCGRIADAGEQATCEEDQDLGHIFSAPVTDEAHPQRTTQIARLNDNRWALVTGNGYRSVNQRPVLLIQYLDGQRELRRLVATGDAAAGATQDTTDNGLSAPRLVDLNGDGRPDLAYAGDLQGNLWKFHLASGDPGQWGVAFGGRPLFTALGSEWEAGPRTLRQPITVPPAVRANDRMETPAGQAQRAVGGMMVAFGTGRNITRRDPDDTAVQSLYAVRDRTRYRQADGGRVAPCLDASAPDCQLPGAGLAAPVPGIGALARRSVGELLAGQGERGFWRTQATVALDWSRHEGWYMDLPEEGERVLKPLGFYDGSNLLAVYSQIPAHSTGPIDMAGRRAETCESAGLQGERQYLSLVNIMDGERPSLALMDSNADGRYDSADREASRMGVSRGAQTLLTRGQHILNHGADERQDVLARMPELSLRPSWRQLR